MREAARNVPEPGQPWDSVDMNNPAEIEDIAHVERFVYGSQKKLSEIVGIDKVQFPPVERIPDAKLEVLYNEMTDLLAAYHFVPDFPEGLPIYLKYRILHDHWDSEQTYVGAGETHLEFCNYYPQECPFPQEYCTCLKFEKEDQDLEERDPDEQEGDLLF